MVKCSSCSSVVDEPTPVNDCYLQLSPIETPYGNMATCDVNMIWPINDTIYFCGISCLKKWVEEQ